MKASFWALGDANARGAFTHTSYNDFEIVAANLFDDDPRRVTDRITTSKGRERQSRRLPGQGESVLQV